MIVTEFGKFGYNRLPIGMCTSVDIFQAKVDKLLGDIKGVKIYINDILFLSKDCFTKHIEQPSIIFFILRAEGLKFNDPKFSFWVKGYSLPSLCYNKGGYRTLPE